MLPTTTTATKHRTRSSSQHIGISYGRKLSQSSRCHPFQSNLLCCSRSLICAQFPGVTTRTQAITKPSTVPILVSVRTRITLALIAHSTHHTYPTRIMLRNIYILKKIKPYLDYLYVHKIWARFHHIHIWLEKKTRHDEAVTRVGNMEKICLCAPARPNTIIPRAKCRRRMAWQFSAGPTPAMLLKSPTALAPLGVCVAIPIDTPTPLTFIAHPPNTHKPAGNGNGNYDVLNCVKAKQIITTRNDDARIGTCREAHALGVGGNRGERGGGGVRSQGYVPPLMMYVNEAARIALRAKWKHICI